MVIDFRVAAPIESRQGRRHHAGDATLRGRQHVTPEARLRAPEQFLYLLDQEGIEKVVIPVEGDEMADGAKVSNEQLAEFCQKDPSRLIGFAGVDLDQGTAAARELEHAVRGLGLKGLNLGPWVRRLPPTDRAYHPLYTKCVELGVPVILHASLDFSLEIPMACSHPQYIDELARDFPGLTIVVTYGGWPWVIEMLIVACRRPNVYIDTAAQRPKHMALPTTGWDLLLRLGDSILQDRILFATRYPLLPFRRTVEEFHQLPLRPEVKEKWLWRNAARLLKLEL